jgi:flap endonuclease-1
MGIKNLFKFLSDFPNVIQEKNVSDYYGKRVAIDISILMYQVVIAIRNTGSDLTNSKGKITSHILGLFNKTLKLLDKGIIPVYVFDGKPPSLKQKTLDNRKQIRNKALEKLADDNLSDAEKIKYFKRTVYITKEQADQCRELLDLLGVPYIDAPEEADSQLAYLCKNNMVYAVLTEDMDILTFGSPRIIRNLLSNKKTPVQIELNQVLDVLKINYNQFVELCILFGCDYCLNLSEPNFKYIYESFLQNLNIDNTLTNLKNKGFNIPDNYKYNDAVNYFHASIHNEISEDKLQLKKPNFEKLVDILVNRYGLIKHKVIFKLIKLSESYNKLSNSNIIISNHTFLSSEKIITEKDTLSLNFDNINNLFALSKDKSKDKSKKNSYNELNFID